MKRSKNQAAANQPHSPAPAPDAAAGPRRARGSVDVLKLIINLNLSHPLPKRDGSAAPMGKWGGECGWFLALRFLTPSFSKKDGRTIKKSQNKEQGTRNKEQGTRNKEWRNEK
ncbi:MAG: hypothetical protein R8P61_30180 [Bacteroidia bacterium]|nr:hypothetical protein [Bacteroidia bacterium]